MPIPAFNELMEDGFKHDQQQGEARIVFEHSEAQDYFGASVFWMRRLSAFGGEQAAIEYWQIKRDLSYRGIVEIVPEAT